MVNNQNEFNEKFSNKKVKQIESLHNRSFQGELIIEDYSELKILNLREVTNIDKIILKNLPKLENCTIWKCNIKELVIDNCPQIKNLNVRRNLLDSLEFIKDLENLEELEVDGNAKLSEILEPYEDDWKVYQKDLQESNENTNTLELLRKIKVLEKEKEFSNIKYDELKKFLKKILISLSQGAKHELAVELNKKINRKTSLSAPGMTKELMLNIEKIVKSWKEIKKDLESELNERITRIEELERKMEEKAILYQQKEKELNVQQALAEELKKQWINAIQESVKSESVAKEKWEQKAKELERKLNEEKEREFELKEELKAKKEEIKEEIEWMRKEVVTPKVQNIWQNIVIGSQSINTYQIQYNVQYQQLETETEKQITASLTDKEVTLEEQKVINKTILFLGTKELFINYRQATINNLIECYNRLEKRLGSKLNKFTNAVSMTNIAGKLASIIPGGGVVEVPIGLLGDTINLTGTIIQGKDLEKFTKQFQEILVSDKKNLSLFDGNYLSLINSVWEDNKTNQREIVSTIIKTLDLKKTEQSPFSDENDVLSQSVSGTWQGRSSIDLGEMKGSIEAVISNFSELKRRLKNEKEQLSKQTWFKTIDQQTDLLQEQKVEEKEQLTETQIEIKIPFQ